VRVIRDKGANPQKAPFRHSVAKGANPQNEVISYSIFKYNSPPQSQHFITYFFDKHFGYKMLQIRRRIISKNTIRNSCVLGVSTFCHGVAKRGWGLG